MKKRILGTEESLRASNRKLRARVKELTIALGCLKLIVGQDAINAAVNRYNAFVPGRIPK